MTTAIVTATPKLLSVEKAQQLLAEAKTIDEAKQLRDQAEAVRIYLRRQGAAQGSILDAQEIEVRAARRIGELTQELPKVSSRESGRAGGKGSPKLGLPSKEKNLVALGLPKQRASEYEAIARLPAEDFEAQIREQRESRAGIRHHAIVQEAKRRETVERLEATETKEVKAALGVYDVLVIDPPWPVEFAENPRGKAELPYSAMTIEEIAGLKIPAAGDAHIWLWTTHRFLPVAFGILEQWGKYVCTFVWHKPGGMQPFGLPALNCEFALYARKGAPKFSSTKGLSVCFEAPRGKHSEKPEKFYEMVCRTTAGRRIDMFNRRAIDGFDGWGKEAQSQQGEEK